MNQIYIFLCQFLILALHPLLIFTLVRLASHSQIRWSRYCVNFIKSIAESQILHHWTNPPVTTVHPTATATNWPPLGTLCGLSGPSSGLNTAGPCQDQHKPLSYLSVCTVGDEKEPNSPNYPGGDQLQQGTEQKGEASHEVLCCWVQGVEDGGAHQKTQTLHTRNRSKQGTY